MPPKQNKTPFEKQDEKAQPEDEIFDWAAEFPQLIGENGKWDGFDVVLGNPPYIDHKKMTTNKQFLSENYQTHSSTNDSSTYFFELALKLLKNGGFFSYINTNKFFRTEYGKKCRQMLAKNQILSIVNFEQATVFKQALVSSAIISCRKKTNQAGFTYSEFKKEPIPKENFRAEIQKRQQIFNAKKLNSRVWSFADDKIQKIKDIIESKGTPLKQIEGIKIFRGVTTGYDRAFIANRPTRNQLIEKDPKNAEIIKPLLKGKDIKKYGYQFDELFLIFTRRNIEIEHYPTVKNYLSKFKKQLLPRSGKGNTGRKPGSYQWFEIQDNTAYYPLFEKPKIVWPLTADKWGYALDKEGFFLTSGGYLLTSENIALEYILAVLNSPLMQFYFSQTGVMTAGGAYTLKKSSVERFPIVEISAEKQDFFIKKVRQICRAKAQNKKTGSFEKDLNKAVYELYSLTLCEIETVENL